MQSISKKYIPLLPSEGQTENYLLVEVGYDMGGKNWWDGSTIKRGYYLYCSPVERRENDLSDGRTYFSERQTIGRGNKMLLKEVSRKSKKAEAEAISLAVNREQELVSFVCACCGLRLAEESGLFFTKLEPGKPTT